MLDYLAIDAVRNLRGVAIELEGQSALFAGVNGSGKTSLLESVHLLSLGRSFRASSARSLIHFDSSHCVVSARVRARGRALTVGIERRRDGGVTARLNRQSAQSLAELNEALPVVMVDTDSARLVAGSPDERRRYMDGTVFHVEHEFMGAWRRYQRALRQRNAGLRHGRLDTDVAWREELSASGEAITQQRQQSVDRLDTAFQRIAARLSTNLRDVAVTLRRGWDAEVPLQEALSRQLDSDRESGYTRVGPHRADLRVLTDGRPAAEVLSRGQQKMAVIAMKLAQGQLIAEGRGSPPLYMVDDLSAELDAEHATRVCSQLVETGAQTLVTAVTGAGVREFWPDNALQLFHVEQGAVRRADT